MAVYLSYTFTISPRDPATEILIAELGLVGFESFVENEDGVIAYIKKAAHHKEILENIEILQQPNFTISVKKREIAPENWNQTWEDNFEPIIVDNLVSIRAPFHQNPQLKYDVVIEPKMSFGTGHHETTHMMIQHLLNLDLKYKQVLDMGCGTGILAIFAEMKGASQIDAIDIDAWCYENSLENIKRNSCNHIEVFHGDASLLLNKKYDLIIANINRNILIHDMEVYINSLVENGILLLSGFYQEDIPIVDREVSKYSMQLENIIERNNWVALQYHATKAN